MRPKTSVIISARASVEALAFWLLETLTSLRSLLGKWPEEIIGTGGVNRSPLLCQCKADVTRFPFRTPEIDEGAALGAAILAGVGAGLFSSAVEGQATIHVRSDRYAPDDDRAALYARHYQQEYRPLAEALLAYYRNKTS